MFLLLLLVLLSALASPAAAVEWEQAGEVKNETALFTRSGQGLLKFENSLNWFLNGRFSEETALHGQFNLVYDPMAVDGYQGHRDNSQHDLLRELYLDTQWGAFKLRLGKQQEVWGKVDGIKLLDIVNPSDFRELMQNSMEESRIPVWMAKASTPLGESGNLQLLVAEAKSNQVPGLSADGEQGHPFILRGVDAITGPANGFLNVTPALGQVANTFHQALGGNLTGFTRFTVQDYVASQRGDLTAFNTAVQYTNHNVTNLLDGVWDPGSPNSAFEYMNRASFATFNSFVNARSAYQRDLPELPWPNVGLRYQGKAGDNVHYSLNYLNHYDANPVVDMRWENDAGDPLQVVERDGAVLLQGGDGRYYGAVDPVSGAVVNRPATLVFRERLNRIDSLGGAFDTTVDTARLGAVVLRGEVLYQIGTRLPVVSRDRLAVGDLAGALTSGRADQLKYVLGAEVVVLTNLTVSTQYIQFINLDYVHDPGLGGDNAGRYTANPAVMNLTNQLQPGLPRQSFGSLYLSKPFGEEQQGRLNNLTIVEERGGYWNRLGVEWAFNGEWIGFAEWNHYWGNADTLFGQFNTRANAMLGVKMLF